MCDATDFVALVLFDNKNYEYSVAFVASQQCVVFNLRQTSKSCEIKMAY